MKEKELGLNGLDPFFAGFEGGVKIWGIIHSVFYTNIALVLKVQSSVIPLKGYFGINQLKNVRRSALQLYGCKM
jgi:hypothetical protein